jgi:hypothetical protein
MTRALAACALGAALLGTAACIPEEGPMMEPGSDCMECHDGGEARRWTAAGTWGGQGNQVVLRDAGGQVLTLRTNRAGNFWTAESLRFPITVAVNGQVMPGPPQGANLAAARDGSCNRCHGSGGGD